MENPGLSRRSFLKASAIAGVSVYLAPIGSPGTLRTDWFPTEAEAEMAQARLVRKKVRRGYRHVEP